MARVEVLSIGNEILSGQVLNTNSHFLCEELEGHGFTVSSCLTIRDDLDVISVTLSAMANRSQILLVTGGLGPTFDDLTTQAVANCISKELVHDEQSWKTIQSKYKEMKREIPEGSEKQASFPTGAKVLPNPFGFAPGFSIKVNDCQCYFLPGVSGEMKAIWKQSVLPEIIKIHQGDKARLFKRSSTVRCFGIPESEFDIKLRQFRFPEGVTPGLMVCYPEIHLRVTVEDQKEEIAETKLFKLTEDLKNHLGDIVFSTKGQALEDVVVDLLETKGHSLSIAESCTAGLVSSKITNVSGSSKVFERGYVTYSNKAKAEDLKIPQDILDTFGAVSSQCAYAMAEGVRHKGGTTYGLSVTGIAGPDGGTPEKPVGLVYFGLATPSKTITKERYLKGDRQTIRTLSTYVALNLLRKNLINQ